MTLPRQRDPHEYVPLSPNTAFGIAGGKNGVLISDNTTKQTIHIPSEYAQHLAVAVLAAGQASKEDA